MRRRLTLALAALALFASACGDDGDAAPQPVDDTASTTTEEDDGTGADDPVADDTDDTAADDTGTEDADPTTTDEIEWVQHVPDGEDCVCADGSEFSYWSRTADPTNVVLYYQGGGACFTAEMCSFSDGTYSVQADAGGITGDGERPPTGIFDFANPDNPLADWSFVFVPYCTGDVHLGDTTQEYSDELTVEHRGFVNASKGLDHIVENFPDAEQILVTGSSAGGVPAPLFGGLASDAFPDADITVLSDASGVYPDNPPINAGIGELWGTYENVPDWTVNDGLTPEDWSIPGLFVQAGLHDPDIRMARYDNAYDGVQQSFSAMAAIQFDDLIDLIRDNEAQIEAAGVPVHSYIAPGTDHTILGRPEFYSLEVEGVSFRDWFTDYIGGADVPDVICTDCARPA